jgi:hypothetical protein
MVKATPWPQWLYGGHCISSTRAANSLIPEPLAALLFDFLMGDNTGLPASG